MAASKPTLKVAIIGAGPSGLAAAISFGQLGFVEWNLYERAETVREIGAGISIQRNAWRMLELLGAAKNINPKDFFRPVDEYLYLHHRNGRTGELVSINKQIADTPSHQLHARTQRAKVQNALSKEVDHNHVHVSKRLVSAQKVQSGRIRIAFADGFEDEVDLLIGADGIRSAVRGFAFPEHKIAYTGRVAYRTLLRADEALAINGTPNVATFWHAPNGRWAYTCPLGDNVFEWTAMVPEPDDGAKEHVSWGEEASLQQLRDFFPDFCPPIQALLDLAPNMQKYALFAGPRLKTVTAHGSVALIGDASHPLSGAFGNGAGFAFEDAVVLAKSIDWAHTRGRPLSEALELFDNTRSPHYSNLYAVLDKFGEADAEIKGQRLTYDEEVSLRIEKNWTSKHEWMYYYKADEIIEKRIQKADSKLRQPTKANL